jgi:hypothetical protein
LNEKSGLLAGFLFSLQRSKESCAIFFAWFVNPNDRDARRLLFARVTLGRRAKKFKHMHELAPKDRKRTLFFRICAPEAKSSGWRGIVIDLSCCL